MNKFQNILLLAGGDGTRFWPLKEKNLFNFNNKPLIQHQIERFISYTKRLYIVVNSENENKINQIINLLPKKYSTSIELIIQRPNLTGQAGAILSAKNKIKGDILIANANDVFNTEILSQFFINSRWINNDCVFLAKKVDQYFPGGYLKFNKNRIIGIVEKPMENKTPSNIVKLVVDYFKDYRLLLKALESIETSSDDWYEQALSKIINITKTKYILYDDYWLVLKYPWQILPMMRFFLEKINKNRFGTNVTISKKSIIIPPVFVGNNVRIGDYSKIVGPVYLTDNTVIGDYSLVRESYINSSSLIGGYCEIARSYLGKHVTLHNNYIGDSVIGDNVLMGAGAITANFRFDGKTVKTRIDTVKIDSSLKKLGATIGSDTKIGVNVSILPGIKIGCQCYVKPGIVVSSDIENNSFI